MGSETEKAFLSQLDHLCRANLIEVKMKTWEPVLLLWFEVKEEWENEESLFE